MRVYELELMGLVVDCPFGETVENCPLKAIRTLPLRDRIRKVEHFSIAKMEKIVTHHKNCLQRRETEKTWNKGKSRNSRRTPVVQ